jgi:hypothetical protein
LTASQRVLVDAEQVAGGIAESAVANRYGCSGEGLEKRATGSAASFGEQQDFVPVQLRRKVARSSLAAR